MSSFRINTNTMAMSSLRHLGESNDQFSRSIERLSTGLRINSGADDPAGLQISEGFRSKIAGLTQAIRNNADATNYAKTAEGALSEASTLLRDARALALANANDATLTVDQKQANQNQLNSILGSLDRIATTTTYGNKKLLDGSAGIKAVVTDSTRVSSLVLSGTLNGASLSSGGAVSVSVATAAVQAAYTGKNITSLATAVTPGGSFAINGVAFQVNGSMTYSQLIDAVNARSGETGVMAIYNSGTTNITFKSTKYGTIGNNFELVDQSGIVSSAGSHALVGGVNAIATVTVGSTTSTNFTGITGEDGLSLKDADGNRLSLTVAGGTSVASNMIGQAQASLATFQVGGEAGQTASLSLSDMSSNALGLNAAAMDIMNSGNLATAISKIDTAITSISRLRGDIGNFMRNTIDSNVRALSIAKENLTDSESSIRDVDMAAEMASFTKYQILQQAGMSVLGQANQAPQGVLSLLRQ